MKFKERLWQLFLMIVLGVTLSVCDAGDSDDDFDENLLTAGTAIASGSSSTSVSSGDGYVKIGDFIINYGNFILSGSSQTVDFGKSHSLIPLVLSRCITQFATQEATISNVTASSMVVGENSGCSSLNNSAQINWVSFGQ